MSLTGQDPYDPERRKSRPLAKPRLVDYAQPLAAPPAPSAVARPHQSRPAVRPEAVVPREDNPLRGWRWLGVQLLSKDLWPREAATNPVMVYFTGRKRGRLTEDWMGVAPWLVLLALESVFLFGFAMDSNDIFRVGLAEFFFVPVFGSVFSACLVAWHLRRVMRTLPLEEMLLTRLKPVDIVQGLSIRPIAVQSAMALYSTLIHIVLVLGASMYLEGEVAPAIAGYVLVACSLRWFFLGMAAESGGANAMRAHLCIQPAMVANVRMVFDLFAVPILVGIAVLLMGVFAYLLLWIASGPLMGLFVLLLIAGGFLWGVGTLAGSMIRAMGADAMDWCHHYPEEWWVFAQPQGGEFQLKERGLFTPWKPIAGQRRGFFALPPKRKKAGGNGA
ncbi:hypothetical protein HZA57_08140 [Candidatus Poribacteria bacterium]|nr:hypothetical protein [Candidatus Poribacteria bacterium]